MDSLSAAQARGIALAAQGLGGRRPPGRIDRRHVLRVLERIGVLQIDSVNVLVRSHYLPLFSRLGPYPRDLLDRLAYRDRVLFEYWAHMASLLPVALQPAMRWRMANARIETHRWPAGTERDMPAYLEAVYREIADHGPLAASDLRDGGAGRGPWWGWSDGKEALEFLFYAGRVAVAGRRGSFERLYDLTERVVPASVLDQPTPPRAEGQRAVMRLAATALGVMTAKDLLDYFHIRPPESRQRLAELVEAGDLVPVEVEGWAGQAYLAAGTRVPRRVEARALLSPFDSLVWTRERTERVFGMRYRIEIYTPAPKRVYGYYVLPFLLGDELVARVDLKADREAGVLQVPSAHGEPGADPAEITPALAAELRTMAEWLGLTGITVGRRGDLARPLSRMLGD